MWKHHSARATAGALRERVTFKTATETKDAALQVIRTWGTFISDVPASKETVSGGETVRGRQMEATTTDVFTIHRLEGLTPMMQLVHQQTNNVYGITKIEDADDRFQFQLIQCKRIANDG